MELRKKLLALLGAKDYVPIRRMEIVNVLRLNKDETKELHQLLDKMLDRGEIARVKKDRLCIPKDADLVSGRILFRQSGSATLLPDAEPGITVAEGYPVSAEDTGVALHGDQVLARINERPKRPYRGKGRGKRPRKTPPPNQASGLSEFSSGPAKRLRAHSTRDAMRPLSCRMTLGSFRIFLSPTPAIPGSALFQRKGTRSLSNCSNGSNAISILRGN